MRTFLKITGMIMRTFLEITEIKEAKKESLESGRGIGETKEKQKGKEAKEERF